MGLLDRFLRSPDARARQIEIDYDEVLAVWKEYYKTIPNKAAAIRGTVSTFALETLKELLTIELVDINTDERTDKEILKELHALEHEERIRRAQQVERDVEETESSYRHVVELLRHLYGILKEQQKVVLDHQRGDPKIVGRDGRALTPEFGEEGRIVVGRLLIGVGDADARGVEELGELRLVPASLGPGGESRPQLSEDDERQAHVLGAAQDLDGLRVAFGRGAIGVGIEGDPHQSPSSIRRWSLSALSTAASVTQDPKKPSRSS